MKTAGSAGLHLHLDRLHMRHQLPGSLADHNFPIYNLVV
jgi:hypothetical protein